MNKDEMIKEMETAIGDALGFTYDSEVLLFRFHTRYYLAKVLVDEGFCKVADDEIVVKKSELERLKNLSKCILTKLADDFSGLDGMEVEYPLNKVNELAKELGIELED